MRIVDTVELFGLKLAERATPNLKIIADEIERWVRAQGGLDALAAQLVARFESMAGKTEDIINGLHGMVRAAQAFGAAVSFGGGMAGRMASDVGGYLSRTVGTAAGRQNIIDTVSADFTKAVSALERITPKDGYTRLVDAVERLFDVSAETAQNTRNPVARVQ